MSRDSATTFGRFDTESIKNKTRLSSGFLICDNGSLQVERSADVEYELVVVVFYSNDAFIVFCDWYSRFGKNTKTFAKEITKTDVRTKIPKAQV